MTAQAKSTNGSPSAVIIVTGLSGAGKSTALSVFEDMGFMTVDGLPSVLAPGVVRMMDDDSLSHYAGIALGMDIRQAEFDHDFDPALEKMHLAGFEPRVFFLEASSRILLQRYATTRRPHPLEKEGLGLEQALDLERERLAKLRNESDLVVDTSTFSIHDLRRVIQNKWKAICGQTDGRNLRVHLIAFGFKYGTPSEADMVFDLRFLPNPYFVSDLRPLCGTDQAVADHVLKTAPGDEYLKRLADFLSWTLTQCETEGRFRLTIALGCTGGRHRSVAIAEALAIILRAQGYTPTMEHRHLNLG